MGLFRQPLQRADALKTADGLWDLVVFGLTMVFHPLVCFGNKLFAADDTGISEITGTVQEAASTGKFKIVTSLLLDNFRIDLSPLPFIHGTGFIEKATVTPKSLPGVQLTQFFQTEIQRQKVVFVAGLSVVADGIPAIIFRFVHQTRSDGVYPVK